MIVLQRLNRALKSAFAIGMLIMCSLSARGADSYIIDRNSFSEQIILSSTSYSFTDGDITWTYRNFKKGSPHDGEWFNGVVLVEMRGLVEGEVTIPRTTPDGRPVTALGSRLFFENVDIDSVVIPDSVEMLFPEVFYGCEYLKEITLPDSINEISHSIFSDCSRLKKVKLGVNIPYISFRMFCKCSSLETIEWSGTESLKIIGSQAFLGCVDLRELALPDSVTNLYEEAFYGCTGITNIHVGANMRTVGARAFFDNSSLLEINFNGNKVREIGGACFSGCTVLRHFKMPDSVREVGTYLLSGCERLLSVQIGDSLELISEGFCMDCESLTNIVWGSSVETLGYRAFLGCVSLQGELQIPDTVETIGSYLFSGCSGLRHVKIGTGCTSILDYAFTGCEHLLTVEAAGEVEKIGDGVFSGCKNLRYFSMNNSKAPVSVGSYSFPRGVDACPLFSIFVKEGSSDWNGVDEIGLPESGAWKYWNIDYVTNKPANITAPYDFGFYIPDEAPGYYGGEWQAPFYLTTDSEFSPANPAVTTIKEGSAIYLHYAFADRWRCEDVHALTNKFTLTSVGEHLSDFQKIEAEMYAYAYEKQKAWDFLQNLKPGSYTLTCELNAGGNLPETDRSNNTQSISFTILEVEKHTVSFDLNGATGNAPAARTIFKGNSIGELPSVAAPAGWTFLGWYTAPTGGQKITGDIVPTDSITCYAQWSKCDLGFVIPNGWPHVLFLTTSGNGTSATTQFESGAPIYVRYAFANIAGEYDVSGFVNRFALSNGSTFDAVWSETLTGGYYGYDGGNWRPAALQNLPDGTYTLTCTLDANDMLAETNEGNNTFSLEFKVGGDNGSGDNGNGGGNPPSGDRELIGDIEGAVLDNAASVYDGYLYNDEVVAGTIQVKVSKPKNGSAKITATIEIVNEKKITVKGDLDLATGTVEAEAKDGRVLNITIGFNGLEGSFGDYEIDGIQNFFSSKDKEAKAEVEAVLAPWIGALNMKLGNGTLSINIAKKGKVTVKGSVGGEKVSAKAQALIGESWMCIPVVYSKKTVNLAFVLWIDLENLTAEVDGIEDAKVGVAGTLRSGAVFKIDEDIAVDIATEDERTIDLLPYGESVSASGKKWIVADGIKAAKVSYKNGEFTITEGKKGAGIANASQLKLTYKEKDGSFKGTFIAYAIEKGKLKKHKVTVEGVLINGVGYGTATIKKIGSWAVTIGE